MTSTDIKTIELIVNSEQAKKRLDELNQRLATMKQKREEALNKGDVRGLQVYSKEIQKIERELSRTESRAQTMSKALANLDRSAPNELKRTLAELNRELNSGRVQRGSAEWDALTRAIRETKTALAQVNTEMRAVRQSSWTDRLAEWGNKWMGLVMNLQVAIQTITGVRQVLQAAVADFAEMEEEMANTRRYTGMTTEQVAALNDVFKQMDTRTSRQQLNELAQEAGRLGKTAMEDVRGYVEAADIINVALVDLGAGATQTIAKLTNIFGVEQLLGTKDAMLAVGSTVNVLSQNCTASKPYLVEFAQRMGGVGAQAGMTIPEILAFGAALDANGQKVEMSASAIGRLTMNLFQKPAEIARQVGLDVEQFTETLKRSTNEGLLMFLERINQLGDKDGLAALAPMFKDLGMDGVRMSQVLATLAKHLDMVRWEQEEANKAFREASSATREYNIFNTTTQAKLDKARKAVSEMRVELGEKLQPVAAHMLNVTTAFLRLLSTTITFVGQHKAAILTLTASIASYTIAVNAAALATKAKTAAMLVANTTTKVYTATLGTLKAAYIALQLAMAKVQGNWPRQSALMLDLKRAGATLATGWGALIAVGIALGGAVVSLTQKYLEHRREMERLRKAREQYRAGTAAISEASKKAQDSYLAEKQRLQELRKTIRDNSRSLDERRAAIAELQKSVPTYLATLNREGQLHERNTSAINDYLEALKKKAIAEALYEKLRESISKEADAEMAAQQWEKGISYRQGQIAQVQQQGRQNNDYAESVTGGLMAGFTETAVVRVGTERQNQAELDRQNKILAYDKQRLAFHQQRVADEQAYQQALWDFARKKGATAELEALVSSGGATTNLATDPGFGTAPGSGAAASGAGGKDGKGGKDEDPVKAALEQLQREAVAKRLYNEMQYQAGLTDERDYQKRKFEIEEEYLAAAQALYEEGSEQWNLLQQRRYDNDRALRKKQEDWSLADIARQEREEQRAAQDKYLAGKNSEQQYEEELLRIKLSYAQRRADYTAEVRSEDAAKYAAAYEEELYRQRLDRRKRFLQQAQELQQEYFKKSLDEQEQDELALLRQLVEQGVIAKEKEEQYKTEIQQKYARLRAEKEKKEADEAAKKKKEADKARGKVDDPLKGGNASLDEWSQAFIAMAENLNSLQQKLKDGEAAWQDYAAVATASLGMIAAVAASFANLYQAQQRGEEQAVEQRYDKEIERVGTNTKKGKKLEEEKQKELAKIKNKYNSKAMTMEIAQATAQTAVAAINAYASAAEVPLIGWKIAPVAAALALAAGAVQIAAIKKQHAAQESGYYAGGFTGGSHYRRQAGIVHEGEFVANHEAVQNPQLLPVLQLIDAAQRSNTVGRLTAADVSRTLSHYSAAPLGAASSVSAPQQAAPPTVQVVDTSSGRTAEALERLSSLLERPIETYVTIDGPQGLHRQYTKYHNMLKRK